MRDVKEILFDAKFFQAPWHSSETLDRRLRFSLHNVTADNRRSYKPPLPAEYALSCTCCRATRNDCLLGWFVSGCIGLRSVELVRSMAPPQRETLVCACWHAAANPKQDAARPL
ncbi:unnamed protein product [Toxocara canis]|uniref:Uncharacterized protein n=1 Tax=Toxocara canis TaxID=6265 RepID=A0A183U085_TOXCA|nr:unnamed protein product [Toxocara canis]